LYSALYIGSVRHRRYAPKVNSFRYRLFYAYLDLDELDEIFAGRWLWSAHRTAPIRFDRKDYLRPTQQPLKSAALDIIERSLGRRPSGSVRLLTHLRHFGYCFNPVSFYYAYEGDRLDAILAEITNTPWGERHQYVLDVQKAPKDGDSSLFQFAKSFHVSPFLPMQVDYSWRFSEPGNSLHVHMTDRIDNAVIFDATLSMQRQTITGIRLAAALLSFPLMTLKVILLIHWQALRLWWKRVPFHSHPGS
jgi:DUF1365 family protein